MNLIPADWPPDYQVQFWKAYPCKKEKAYALRMLDKVAFAGKTKWADLILGLERYILSEQVKKGFVKYPATWLNKGCWEDEADPPKPDGTNSRGLSFFEIAAGHGGLMMADIEAELEYILRRHPISTMADLERLDDDEIVEGYRDGSEGLPCGDNRSRSYWHGWRNGMMDRGRLKPDWASMLLVKEYVADTKRPRWA